MWLIRDAHEVDPAEILSYCARNAAEVALMAEYIAEMPKKSHLREYLLCAVSVEDGHLAGLCWIGGNIVPSGIPQGAFPALLREIRRRNRWYSSIVGPQDQVRALHTHAGGAFGEPREIRDAQPHLEMNARPEIEPDPLVHPTHLSDVDVLLPAAVAMFTEEVGYSPLTAGSSYARRVHSLVSQGRSLCRIEDRGDGREVVFKADLGTIGFGLTQIQGVWVNPKYRGQGLAAPAMASVVNYAHQYMAPTVSLYVNDFNAAALATYARVGFVRTGTFSTILY